MEDEQGLPRRWVRKQLGCQLFLVVEINGTIDVASTVLVLEAAIDDKRLIVVGTVLAFQYLDYGLFRDSGNRVLLGEEVGELELRTFVYIHDRLEGTFQGLLGRLVL